MAHAFACVEIGFASAIEARGGGREDLADPVGSDGEKGRIREGWHAAPLPAREIGHEDLRFRAEVQFGFAKEHPATGAAVGAAIEG